MKQKLIWFSSLVLVAFVSRMISHPANLSPLLAIALITTRTVNPFWGLLGLLAAVMTSDLVLGFDQSQLFVYLGLVLVGFLGFRSRNTDSAVALGAMPIAGSSIFFIVSNFGTWLTTSMYSKTAVGLIHCYLMAIPFFWRSLASDFFFFGGLLLISKMVLSRPLRSSSHHA